MVLLLGAISMTWIVKETKLRDQEAVLLDAWGGALMSGHPGVRLKSIESHRMRLSDLEVCTICITFAFGNDLLWSTPGTQVASGYLPGRWDLFKNMAPETYPSDPNYFELPMGPFYWPCLCMKISMSGTDLFVGLNLLELVNRI